MKFPQLLARSRLRSFLLKHKMAFKHIQLATNRFLLWLIRLLRRSISFTRRYPYALLAVLMLSVIGLVIPSDTAKRKITTVISLRSEGAMSPAISLLYHSECLGDDSLGWSLIPELEIEAYFWHSKPTISIPLADDSSNIVIDSGVDTLKLHADLQFRGHASSNSDANCLMNDSLGYNFVDSEIPPNIEEHGTHMAGIISRNLDSPPIRTLALDVSIMNDFYSYDVLHRRSSIKYNSGHSSHMASVVIKPSPNIIDISETDFNSLNRSLRYAYAEGGIAYSNHHFSGGLHDGTYYCRWRKSGQGMWSHFVHPERLANEEQETNNLTITPVAIAMYGSDNAFIPPLDASSHANMSITRMAPLPPNEVYVAATLVSPQSPSNTLASRAVVNWLWILGAACMLLLGVLVTLLWRATRSQDPVFHPPKRKTEPPLMLKDVMRLIARAELEQALNLLENALEARNEDILHQIILLQFQLHEVEREYRKSVITYEENHCMKNRIVCSTLELLSQIRAQPQLSSIL